MTAGVWLGDASFLWRPAGPPMLIVGGGLAVAALAAVAYLRTWGPRPAASALLLLLRLAAVAVIIIVLMGPSHVPPSIRAETRGQLTVLLDTSGSMTTGDCGTVSRVRFAIERWLDAGQVRRMEKMHDVTMLGFDEALRPLSGATLERPDDDLATGTATRLSHALLQALSRPDTSDGGHEMLVLSDGHETEDAPLAPVVRQARTAGVPIHTVCLGGRHATPDVAVIAVPAQEYLMAEEPGKIMVRVYQRGYDDERVVIRLRDGVGTRDIPVDFRGRGVVEAEFVIEEDEPGQFEYEVSVTPFDTEIETLNNTRVVFTDVLDDRIKVLVLEGQPFWDTKFLAQSLRKDEHVELRQITQVSTSRQETIVSRGEADDDASRPPSTVDDFARHDVIVLGCSVENILSEASAAALHEFVSNRGGHVIFARGRPYDPDRRDGLDVSRVLEDLEPVTWDDGVVDNVGLSLTDTGRTSSWLDAQYLGIDLDDAIERLPGFTIMRRIRSVKPATIVHVEARPDGAPPTEEGLPAVVTMNYGRGSVAAVLGEGLWQWSLLGREHEDLAGLYATFWSGLVRTVAFGGDLQPGKAVNLRLSNSTVSLDESITVDVVYRRPPPEGTEPSVRLTDPSGETVQVPLRKLPGHEPRFRASLTPKVEGAHAVSVASPDGGPPARRRFSAYLLNMERLSKSARPEVLRYLAEETGGRVLRPHEADDFIGGLERRELASLIPSEPIYIWDRFWILIGLLTWLGIEWLARRKAGLL